MSEQRSSDRSNRLLSTHAIVRKRDSDEWHCSDRYHGLALYGVNSKDSRFGPIHFPPLIHRRHVVAEVWRGARGLEKLDSIVPASLQWAVRSRQATLQGEFSGNLL